MFGTPPPKENYTPLILVAIVVILGLIGILAAYGMSISAKHVDASTNPDPVVSNVQPSTMNAAEQECQRLQNVIQPANKASKAYYTNITYPEVDPEIIHTITYRDCNGIQFNVGISSKGLKFLLTSISENSIYPIYWKINDPHQIASAENWPIDGYYSEDFKGIPQWEITGWTMDEMEYLTDLQNVIRQTHVQSKDN